MMKKIVLAIIMLALVDSAIAASYGLAAKNIQQEISEKRQSGLKMGNEPFFIGDEKDSAGIILFHGFTASPWEVRELSEYLASKNISVYGSLVAGHGTSERDLKNSKWEDWYKSAEESFKLMSGMFGCVYVGGMSAGGALALMIAENYDVCGVVSIGTPIYFQDWKIKYAWLFKYIMPYTTRELSDDVKPYYYERRPTAAVAELYEMINAMKAELYKVDEPIIIIQSLKDQTIKPESAEFIMTNVSSKDETFIWFNEGQHVIIKDDQREEVFRLIAEFINTHNK